MSTITERAAMSTGDVRVTYRDYGGDGKPLVLLHGIGGNLQTMDGLARRLAVSRRCVTIEVRGCGQSDATDPIGWPDLISDVDAVVAQLKLGAVDLVGHSLGGMIGAAYAAEHSTTRLVSIDGLPPGTLSHASESDADEFDEWLTAAHQQLYAMTARPATGDAEWFAEELQRVDDQLERLGYDAPDRHTVAARQFREIGHGRYRRNPSRALVDAVFSRRTQPVLSDYQRATATTLLIVCEQWAPPALVADVAALAEQRSGLQLVRLPVTHLAPVHDAVDQVAALIDAFLTTDLAETPPCAS